MFHNNNNKIYKVNTYKNLFYANTTLVKINHNLSMKLFKPTFEHKIAKNLNVRTQNSKESNSQNTLKNLYVGNLNKNTSEEDLYELFGLQNTTYLKENCCVKIVLSKSGLSKGFAFITAPDYVCTELIKSNGTDFKSHRLTIEEVLVKPKVKEPPPSGNKTTEIKNYQTPIEEVPVVLVVPGEKSYSEAKRSHNNVFNTIIF